MNTNRKLSKKEPVVLGRFTGKCCDYNVMNNNDMHLGRELFENLMASDEYKRAMKYGHYIGFLSHPEDSDCQDDRNACIVMRDMRILDNGDIEGDFDLINTPVGQIVKAFTDAGVKYGLSIRGLGDVAADGEVDPDGFIFRGFDLVRFPAYDDCIPEFKEIAASTDAEKKAAYKKICASIDANLSKITSSSALELIQEGLVDDSDEYNMVQNRIDEINAPEELDIIAVEPVEEDVMQEKLNAMTELYLEAAENVRTLSEELVEKQAECQDLVVECSTIKNKYARYKRIVANQLEDANAACDRADARVERYKNRYSITASELKKTKKSLTAAAKKSEDLASKLADSEAEAIKATTALENRIDRLLEKSNSDKEEIKASQSMNLKYQRKIEANSEVISQKDSTIEDLKQQLHETVMASKKLESKASNLDDKCGKLLSRVEAAEEMVLSYQQAYANMYANALGVYLPDLSVTAETSVDELKQMITAGTSTANIAPKVDMLDLEDEEQYDEEDSFLENDVDFDAEMTTL